VILLRSNNSVVSRLRIEDYGVPGSMFNWGWLPMLLGLTSMGTMTHGVTMKLRSLIAVSALALSSVLVMSLPAQAATRIKFKKGSYCGTYTGNFRGGKTFVLGLDEGQKFSTRNIGNGTNTNFYVTGPTGELQVNREDRSTLYYFTEGAGDHFIKITSTIRTASVEFCAY
jgi:hypothetical protein